MQKYIKTGLLIIVLVVPVLVFIFLQGYTTNHFDLPYYVPLRDSVTNEIVVENGDTAFYQIRDFSLPSLDSQAVITAGELRGKTTVVSAFKGKCDQDCEKVLSQLTRINALHETYPRVVLLTIINEDKGLAKSLIARQKPGWQIAQIPDSIYTSTLKNVFHLAPKSRDEKTILGNNQFSLIDDRGYIRGYYDARKTEEIERLLGEIRILEYNKKTAKK